MPLCRGRSGAITTRDETYVSTVTPDDLRAALDLARNFALTALIRSSSGVGFPEELSSGHVRPWGGTADGVSLLLLTGEPVTSVTFRQCARWLYRNQNPVLGSWDSRGVPLTEATATVVTALTSARRVRARRIEMATRFILSNQLPNGAFSPHFPRPKDGRVYTTSLAVRALDALRVEQRSADRAAEWLLDVRAKRDEGPWPAADGQEPSAAHTALALLALLPRQKLANATRIRTAVDWLRAAATEPLSAHIELRRAGPHDQEIRTIHLSSALAVSALVAGGVSPLDRSIQTQLADLLARQEQATGAFLLDLASVSGERFIWATTRSVEAIHAVLESRAIGASAVVLSSAVEDLSADIARVERELRRARLGRAQDRWIAVGLVLAAIAAVRSNADLHALDIVRSVWSLSAAIARDQGWYAVAFSLLLSATLAAGGYVLRTRFRPLGRRLVTIWRRIRPW